MTGQKQTTAKRALTFHTVLTSDPLGSGVADIPNFWESTRFRVSKGGLEPPRPYERQPLKLVRLPISPLRRGCTSYIDAFSAPTKTPITLKTFFSLTREGQVQ